MLGDFTTAAVAKVMQDCPRSRFCSYLAESSYKHKGYMQVSSLSFAQSQSLCKFMQATSKNEIYTLEDAMLEAGHGRQLLACPTGCKGAKGARGARGRTGPRGLPGVKGAAGAKVFCWLRSLCHTLFSLSGPGLTG